MKNRKFKVKLWSKEELDHLADIYLKKEPKDLEIIFNRSRQAIAFQARKMSLGMRSCGIIFSQDQESKIVELYNNGKSPQKIAIELGSICTYGTIRNFLLKKNLSRSCSETSRINEEKRIGEKIGLLTLISRSMEPTKSGERESVWTCECACGNIKKIKTTYLITERGPTKSCGCFSKKGHEEISGSYWGSLKAGARNRKIEFDISIQDSWDLFLRQDRKCAISGLPICFAPKGQEKTASLDRIDSYLGYTIKNIQWVHKYVNFLKREVHDRDFFTIVKHIYEFQKLDKYETKDLLEAFKDSPYFHRFT